MNWNWEIIMQSLLIAKVVWKGVIGLYDVRKKVENWELSPPIYHHPILIWPAFFGHP